MHLINAGFSVYLHRLNYQMIKRLTGISIILLANFILLAHNAIPHHHHPHKVCLATAHCPAGESAPHTHDGEMPEHEHDGSEGEEPCTLKQVVAVPPNQWRHIAGANDALPFSDSGIPIESVIHAEPTGSGMITGQLIVFPFIPFHILPPDFTSSGGLRAPPTV